MSSDVIDAVRAKVARQFSYGSINDMLTMPWQNDPEREKALGLVAYLLSEDYGLDRAQIAIALARDMEVAICYLARAAGKIAQRQDDMHIIVATLREQLRA